MAPSLSSQSCARDIPEDGVVPGSFAFDSKGNHKGTQRTTVFQTQLGNDSLFHDQLLQVRMNSLHLEKNPMNFVSFVVKGDSACCCLRGVEPACSGPVQQPDQLPFVWLHIFHWIGVGIA